MLTAVPLPDQPLRVLWQSTVVDIEPGSRYGHRNDAAAINTTLAVTNDTGSELSFPLILATTDADQPAERVSIRVADQSPKLETAHADVEWETFANAIRQAAIAQGHEPQRIEDYLAVLHRRVRKIYKTVGNVTLAPGQQRFIRSHQRKRVKKDESDVYHFVGIFPLPQFALVTGGSISVTVALPRATQTFGVDLVDWTRNYGPQAFGKDPGLPQVAGRFVVSWFWRNDPELSVSYRY
jgi:hypothetical protein